MRSLCTITRLIPLLLVTLSLASECLTQNQTEALTPPVELTAQEDHARMMKLQGIVELRPGANPNDPESSNAVNYDEAKANPYPHLPDPLLNLDRRRVTSPKLWWEDRRPEIVELFDREVYGRVPKNTPPVHWEIVSTTEEMEGEYPIIKKELRGRVDNTSYPLVSVEIELTLATPAGARSPVPVILEFGFKLPGRFRGRPPWEGEGPSWKEQVLARGWGYAVMNPTSVQADNGGGLTRGIIGLVNRGQPRRLEDWGTLRAWAWGASRVLDYFEKDDAVDATRVGIEGLSRYGKAAIVAMAYDQRFAAGFIASSGASGVKLHRRDLGERLENVASTAEYHWMAGNFLKYAGPLSWDDLPVDSHELVALCAPRPVFISVGSPEVEGQWIDAKGMFMAGVAAGPVYELLGKRGLGTDTFPPIESPLVEGEIAFRQHSGGHTAGPNWPVFLEWVSRYLE